MSGASPLATREDVFFTRPSAFLLQLLEIAEYEEIPTLELPDYPRKIVSLLLEVTYKGIVEATIDDLRELVLLAHTLYVKIPVSEELLEVLELDLPDVPPLSSGGLPRLKQRPSFSPAANGSPTHSNSLIPLSKAISHRVPQGGKSGEALLLVSPTPSSC